MIGLLLQQLAQQVGQFIIQYINSPAGQNALRGGAIIVSKQLDREIKRWYNQLSPEEQKRVDSVINWAIKEALGLAASHFGGPVAGVIVKKAVDLAMNELNEDDEAIRTEVKAMIETKITSTSKF